jgi:hypothetical protein
MKRIAFISFVLLGALAVSGGLWPSGKGNAAPRRESAVVEFTQTVKLQGVLLRGEYLVVHDDERMENGEPCTYIYQGNRQDEAKLVIAFHCIHVERDRADAFKVTFSHHPTTYGVPEVKEIQFAGSRDGHQVP